MLRLSMFCLVCALTCGVFGFGTGVAPAWLVARTLFFLFFILAMAFLAWGTLGAPTELASRNRKQIAYF
jgi:uncharacterized membrane protein YtjA (UPF0391 family)